MWAEGRRERESGVVTWSRGQGARPPQVGARAAALILGRPDPWRVRETRGRDRCHFLEAACRVANQGVGATGRLCRVTRAVGVRDYRCVSPCRITPLG